MFQRAGVDGMSGMVAFLGHYGYAALFGCVLLEQLGLPLPAAPLLLAAGALAGLGELNLAAAWLLAVGASLIGDSLWYYLGKTRGLPVLRLLCRISLEPDACVRRTNLAYSKHGTRWLLFAKFVPGLGTVAPPMAGVYGLGIGWFLAMDGAGAGLWAGVFLLAGWCFRGQMDAIAFQTERLGGWVGLAAAGALVVYLLFKYFERRRVHRALRVARIAPMELKRRLELGEAVTIVDLRNSFEWEAGRIPGSFVLTEEELDAFVPAFPEAEMILYCSCPNEVSSAAAAAIRLQRRGVRLVRPLEGGFPLWTELGFPVEVAR
ncbi:rhodanese-like domain-containing protein [Paludibaculum fermentans]|uniref:VTT domain-containing protein n=1 Tax=Paludibaculum fermentans TaxID=1473598 RepID=A0A7S7NVE0_PALFE|nr:rhodanese-like domain-containing protein [Paludibaculum fermentans]QOY90527.1 VTT domain-containing protein [Paludibaculum fermentans]